MWGGIYADALSGDGGANKLWGLGGGDDELHGGLGDDVYVFGRGSGTDTVRVKSGVLPSIGMI